MEFYVPVCVVSSVSAGVVFAATAAGACAPGINCRAPIILGPKKSARLPSSLLEAAVKAAIPCPAAASHGLFDPARSIRIRRISFKFAFLRSKFPANTVIKPFLGCSGFLAIQSVILVCISAHVVPKRDSTSSDKMRFSAALQFKRHRMTFVLSVISYGSSSRSRKEYAFASSYTASIMDDTVSSYSSRD